MCILILPDQVFAWGAAACVFPAIHHGYGKHTVAAGLIKVINFLKV